ncbi:MAG: VWA domain-containing protein [Deltaproteobacteria bacterium]|nr:VWA domain-containing protein [Deltaproteobacteria bacterium]
MLRRIRAAVIAIGALAFVAPVAAAPCPTAGPNLTLNNITCQMSGIHTFTTITLTNNAVIQVNPYVGGSKTATGNLELRATNISIDATSRITAKGAGYQTPICGDGRGPSSANGTGDTLTKVANTMTLTDSAGLFNAGQVGRTITIYGATTAANNGLFVVTAVLTAQQLRYTNAAGVAEAFTTGSWIVDDGAAGQGGCAVRDSGGGGAHFGRGGRGTNDISGTQTFPADFEEDCGNTVTYNGTGVPGCNALGAPASTADCRNNDGLPSIAGSGYFHSIYAPEFGASGGDKGCRDGDGTTLNTAGGGGGRIVLAALNGGIGLVTINGTIEATGRRGCGIENDSGGGGAGGTIFIVGDNVSIGANALVTAAGGLGGDTQGALSGGECAAPFQQSGTCDDCGGGGGGGLISVLSGASASINDGAVFNVDGALGGVCPICNGEAGGGVGEIQISGGYVGEFCDGFDNNFNDQIDENLGTLNCGTMTIQACQGGVPQQCAPQVPACQGPVTDSRARFTIILDTSGSMLGNLAGTPTFGDGSVGHAGRDFDGNGLADDSRLFKAKAAVSNVISAYPNVDFALARYHQDQSLDRSCQLAHNFECRNPPVGICCTYDNPGNNTGAAPTPACTVNGGTSGPIAVLKNSPGDECINYSGSCPPPRRGADVVAGFGKDINQYLMWLDGTEANFINTQTVGDYCNFPGGGDCEFRGTGPTPLANSLNAAEDFLTPIKACDLASTGGCRNYSVILLTDGAESCQGDPVAAAAALRAKGINTFVVGFSTQPAETAQLNAVAAAGGTGSAFFANDENALANALAGIVSDSIIFETCNDLDDDCDTRVDEDFPGKGLACNNNKFGACFRQGTLACSSNGQGLVCTAPNVTCNASNRLVDQNGVDLGPCTETCNMIDDDCDAKIDEGLGSCTCVVQGAEQCDGQDDDCDTIIDEDTDIPCGTGVCLGVRQCNFVPGCDASTTCTGANCCYGACSATPATTEVCNGLDDDCNGNADGFQQACSNLNNGFPAFDPLNNPGANHMPDSGCETLNAMMPGTCRCQPGTRTCPLNGNGMFGACSGEITPTVEICNGFDDDCDGRIDETPPTTCTTNAQCAGTPMTPTCDNPSGLPGMGTCELADCSTNCGVGQLVCQNGMQVCNATTAPDDDSCDGNDDDCDGMIDEDWECADPDGVDNIPNNADDCPCSIAGQCNATESCQNGAVICQGMPTAQETCNCQDDNCNGQIDEGTLCPTGAACTSCQCAFRCSPGEFPCPLGKKCKGMAPNDFCVADPCFNVTCPTVPGTKQICIEDPNQANASLCVAACSQVTCPGTQVCIPQTGECKPDDCTTFPQRCNANQSCIVDAQGVGQCVTNPCAGVTCGAEEYCVDNMCHGSCAGVECATGQRCRLGTCEVDPCGAPCPFGKECQDSSGNCEENPCAFVTCQPGQWCNPNNGGMCEPDPCKIFDVECPNPTDVCKGGSCYDPASFLPDAGVEEIVTTGGGGGCQAGGADAGWLVGLALLVMRRRRKGGRS